MSLFDRASLEAHVAKGKKVKYLFFWGHTQTGREPTKACFSQWFPSPFKKNGITYPTAEHYMMAGKAKCFGDEAVLAKILASRHPGKAKILGRQITPFNQETWDTRKWEIVVQANLAKFSQHPDLKAFLLSTKNRVLVEASPRDRIWGIGLSTDNPKATNPALWKGENLLGFALMQVRDLLRVGDVLRTGPE